MEATETSISRWMDKEVVVHIHNGILLSYKKEHIWVSVNEVDEPRAYYTEWSKSEREREILHTNAYIYMESRKMVLMNLFARQQWRNRDREETWGEGKKGWMYEDSNVETYITICKLDSQWEFAVWLRELKQGLCINLEEWSGGAWEEVQEGGDICTPMVDSYCCLTENNKIL